MKREDLDYANDIMGFRIVESNYCSSGKVVEIYKGDDEYYTKICVFDIFWVDEFYKMAKIMKGLK